MEINNPLTYGRGNLPEHVLPDQPYEIFSLFFTEPVLETLAQHTNEYAALFPAPEDKPFTRTWRPTTVKELRAYIGVYIYAGIHPETAMEDYWNTDPLRGPLHELVTRHIGLQR